MQDICLNCGQVHKSILWGAQCNCDKPNVVHQIKCNGCPNIIGFICDDDHCCAEKIYCHECLNKVQNNEKFEKKFIFSEYSVILTNHTLAYVLSNNTSYINFDIKIDEEKDGGKIELNFSDRNGSRMQFIHYRPSDLKGMFDFIAKGYNVKI